MKQALTFCLYAGFLMIGPGAALAQDLRLIDGEMVTCEITLSRPAEVRSPGGKAPSSRSRQVGGTPSLPMEKKIIRPLLNQAGSFDRVADIRPQETVEVQLTYPDGKEGEQVAVSVEDGGALNQSDMDQKVGVYHLDALKTIRFSFTTTDAAGLYRLAARKEFETRIVQLWVGPELSPVQGSAQKND